MLRRNLDRWLLSVCAALSLGLMLPRIAEAGCPRGTTFFAWEEKAGCIKTGTTQMVTPCITLDRKACASGRAVDAKHPKPGKVWCCFPPPRPQFPPLLESGKYACFWRGTAPFCEGKCEKGEVNSHVSRKGKEYPGIAGNFGKPCLKGFKAYCCKKVFGG